MLICIKVDINVCFAANIMGRVRGAVNCSATVDAQHNVVLHPFNIKRFI